MRIFHGVHTAVLVAGCACLLLSGCGTTSCSRFYTLPPVQNTTAGTKTASTDAAVVLGVGPVPSPITLTGRRLSSVPRTTSSW